MTIPALPVLVERWRRYGHDRAYVKIKGRQIGYRDLKTGEVVSELPDRHELIERATAHLLAVAVPTTPATAVVAESGYEPRHAIVEPGAETTPTPVLLPEYDLALNPPGLAARQQATAYRDAAPIKTFLTRIAGIKTEERSWRIGADAEVEVGRRLTRLDARWRVLHAVPIGDRDSDIDHVVIGPAGVFTVNTKHHPDANIWVRGDTFKVNGQNQHYIRNSRHESDRARRLLRAKTGVDVGVNGLIVVMGASGGFVVKGQPADGRVAVVQRRRVTDHLNSLPAVLGPESVTLIYQAARHLSTWQPKTVRWSEL